MPNPGDLEVIYCHPYPQTRQGLLSRNFISANLTTLPGSESYEGHNALLSKIARSMLPEATCRWLSNYIRGTQSVTSSRGVKSKARIIHTGVPQGSKLSPALFSFYIADMPRPTEPVKWICYADDITVVKLERNFTPDTSKVYSSRS